MLLTLAWLRRSREALGFQHELALGGEGPFRAARVTLATRALPPPLMLVLAMLVISAFATATPVLAVLILFGATVVLDAVQRRMRECTNLGSPDGARPRVRGPRSGRVTAAMGFIRRLAKLQLRMSGGANLAIGLASEGAERGSSVELETGGRPLARARRSARHPDAVAAARPRLAAARYRRERVPRARRRRVRGVLGGVGAHGRRLSPLSFLDQGAERRAVATARSIVAGARLSSVRADVRAELLAARVVLAAAIEAERALAETGALVSRDLALLEQSVEVGSIDAVRRAVALRQLEDAGRRVDQAVRDRRVAEAR